MKNIVLFFFLMIALKLTAIAQSVNGDWYGIGNVSRSGEHSSYMAEMILKQSANNKVTGQFNYFFKSVQITSEVSGTYYPKTRTLELKSTPVLNYKANNINGADCPMEGSFTLMVSKAETSLRGQFNPLYAYRFTCPAINIKFKKEVDKPKIDLPVQPEVLEEFAAFLKPEPEPTIDTAVLLLNKRTFDVLEEIEVYSDTLIATLYDNGEVDMDTVSMFFNKQLIANKSLLSDKPLTFKLPVNDTSVHEISMYAENLGSLPPNTALLIIMDGERRLEFNLMSNFIKNSTLRFRRKEKDVSKTSQ